VLSPYQFNPLGVNPLRTILAEEVDFARLRRASPVRLLVAVTRVSDGGLRLIRERDISLEAVLASASVPHLHHAVEIEGEEYWDGGYSANPPLRQLVPLAKGNDLVLVEIMPEMGHDVPRLPGPIAARVGEIAFTAPLRQELEAIADLQRLSREAGPFSSRFARRFARLRLHRIVAATAIEGLQGTDAANIDPVFLARLRDHGRAAAAAWLGEAAE
jgi:NTE family protein